MYTIKSGLGRDVEEAIGRDRNTCCVAALNEAKFGSRGRKYMNTALR
jgi:hypothetical protein